MLKKFFKKNANNQNNLTKPDLHTHRKSPLESYKAIKLAEDAIDDTKNIIEKVGSRISGSNSCLNAAEIINNKLGKYCDFTFIQNFKHKGQAYTFWISLIPFVYSITLFLLIIGFSIIPFLINACFVFYVFREFIILEPIFEKNIKESEAKNVHGVIEPDEEVKQTIIFSSHHDSAQLVNKNRGEKGYFLNVELPFILYAFLLVLNFVEIIVEIITNRLLNIGFPQLSNLLILIILAIATPIIFKLRNYYSKEGSPGAGDNLISTNIVIQLSKYFNWAKKNNKGLKNTRIIFVSFDAEEVGLRGSKVWFDKHQSLFKNAIQLNFDCIYNSDELVFIDSDINGLKSLSKEMSQKCVKLANNMGYKTKSHPLPFLSGATDAARAIDYDIKACTLMAMDLDKGIKNTFFHTEKDTYDKIEKGAVEKAISIAIKLSNDIDKIEIKEEENTKETELKKDVIDLIKFNKISRR